MNYLELWFFCLIRIAQIVPGSQAERMGLLSVGDQILAVNGIPTCGLHHDEVVRLIRESGSASRGRKHPLPMRDSVEFPVTLFRGSRGFGFSIRGGQEFNRMPLVVLRIADGGAAQMDGHLKVHFFIVCHKHRFLELIYKSP
ncbi:uncharacterized protein DC041_0012763 [Schistosoma bovis]|uniref:PDZ domain-containing protein n=1 Tax=Schistosoma bovis TaxID=6184 RepID=A0A430QSZ2_SCHBO|nr:uncharacterized protein DC041_0012763 [Schistosoma bovis]